MVSSQWRKNNVEVDTKMTMEYSDGHTALSIPFIVLIIVTIIIIIMTIIITIIIAIIMLTSPSLARLVVLPVVPLAALPARHPGRT